MKNYVTNVQSKYFNKAELLHIALVVRVAELLSQRTYVPNVKSKYINTAQLLHSALIVTVAELLSPRTYLPKDSYNIEIKIRLGGISKIFWFCSHANMAACAKQLFQKKYVPNVKLKFLNIAELLHNAGVIIVAELLSQRTYVPNLQSKYCNIA